VCNNYFFIIHILRRRIQSSVLEPPYTYTGGGEIRHLLRAEGQIRSEYFSTTEGMLMILSSRIAIYSTRTACNNINVLAIQLVACTSCDTTRKVQALRTYSL